MVRFKIKEKNYEKSTSLIEITIVELHFKLVYVF